MDHPPAPASQTLIAKVNDPELLSTYSLVLSAADITHRIEYLSADCFAVYVAEHKAERARHELAAYERENLDWPPQILPDDFVPTFRAMSSVVIGLLIFMYGLTGEWNQQSRWFQEGAGDSTAILDRFEFYRLITPLTLHADLLHLLSNCFLGGILLHYFLHLTGNGLGLLAILLTAAMANLINVAVHGPGHLFVGFSTAIFAVIGMLCTISFALRTGRLTAHFLMPVMSGLALLAFLGASGERTDLGAHLFGLLCGLTAGNFVRLPVFTTLRASLATQTVTAILVGLTVLVCWLAALAG